MKKLLLLFVWVATMPSAFAQLGISFHQSNLPFFGVNYEFKDRFLTELRLGTDSYLEDVSAEAVITYQFLNQDDYEFYAGVGARVQSFGGLVIPVGFNFFPFDEKKFGFHIEVAPIIAEDASIFRGSWGIRYRFLK